MFSHAFHQFHENDLFTSAAAMSYFGLMTLFPALLLLFDGVSRPARCAGQDSAAGKKKARDSAGRDSRLKSISQCLISGGSLPPFISACTSWGISSSVTKRPVFSCQARAPGGNE